MIGIPCLLSRALKTQESGIPCLLSRALKAQELSLEQSSQGSRDSSTEMVHCRARAAFQANYARGVE
jgi:hypothetical protein